MALALAACSSEGSGASPAERDAASAPDEAPVVAQPDAAGADVDAGPDAPTGPDPEQRMMRGGLSGGAIAGRVTFRVFDYDTLQPIAGAAVRVVAGALEVDALTDAAGVAVAETVGLAGPVDLHVFAPEREYLSWYAVDAAEVWAPARMVDGPRPERLRGAFEGEVAGLDALAEPAEGEHRFAEVRGLIRWPMWRYAPQAARAGTPGAHVAWVGQGTDVRDFSVVVEPNQAVGACARAGVSPTDKLEFVTATHLALPDDRAAVHVGFGETVAGYGLTVSVPLDQTLVVTMDQPSGSLPEIRSYVRLASGELCETDFEKPVGGQAELAVPSLTGPLEGASLWAFVELLNPDSQQVLGPAGGGVLSAGEWMDIPTDHARQGRTLAVTAPEGADLMQLNLMAGSQTLWKTWRPSSGQTASVTLPQVPAGLPDRVEAAERLGALAYDLPEGFDTNDASVQEVVGESLRTSTKALTLR